MKRVAILILAFFCVGLLVYFVVPKFLFPSGVWVRRVIRDNPLQSPIIINSIRDKALASSQREYKLAGVKLPSDPDSAQRANDFLRLVTAQGVEVIRVCKPTEGCVLRCEPRIWHWCGNDSIGAHFQQFNLNELILAFGYATFDAADASLNDTERLRFRAAEVTAQERKYGMWSGTPSSTWDFSPQWGLNISQTSSIPIEIEIHAADLQEPSQESAHGLLK